MECAFLQCSVPPFYLPHDPCILNILSYMLNGIEWAGVWYSGIGQTVPRTGWTVESRIALGYGIPLDGPTYPTW